MYKAVTLNLYRSKLRLPLNDGRKSSAFQLISAGLNYAQAHAAVGEMRCNLRKRLQDGEVLVSDIQGIILELLVGDAVEYIEYYVSKEGKHLKGLTLADARLKALLQTRSVGQVFMLLWRAIKNSIQAGCRSSLLFEDIIQRAWEYNIDYRKRDASVDCYARPESLKYSKVASILFYELLELPGDTDQLIGPQAYLSASVIFNSRNEGSSHDVEV